MLRAAVAIVALASMTLPVASSAVSSPAARNGLIAFVDYPGNHVGELAGDVYSIRVSTPRTRNLSRSAAASSAGVVSPDGRSVAFFSRRAGYAAVYVVRTNGTALRRVTSPSSDVSNEFEQTGAAIAWSPNGRSLAFDGGSALGGRVAVLSLARPGATRSLGVGFAPSWSADGTRIAYTEGPRVEGRTGSIVVATPTGRRLWSRPGDEVRWSPRGGRLAVAAAAPNTDVATTVITNSRGRRLASVTGRLPSWSPDGRWLALVRRDGLYVSRWNGRSARRLGNVASHAWAPDSRRIAFAGQRGTATGVWVARVSGGSARRIGGFGQVAGWAPLGRILLLQDLAADGVGRIVFVVRPDGRLRKLVVRAQPRTVLQGVAFGDRGRSVVYRNKSTFGVEAVQQVLAVRPNGSGLRPLTFDGREKATPAWSPDGTRIAYAAAAEPGPCDPCGFQIRVQQVGAGESTVVGGTNAGEPAWAPDATRIAYVERTADGPKIVVAALNGPGATTIGEGQSPAWSPAGDRIAFVSAEGERVAVMDVDGSNAHQVAAGTNPAWLPDGEWITYATPRSPGIPGTTDVRAVHPDGTSDHLLVSDLQGVFGLALSPDGRHFACTTWRGLLCVVPLDGAAPYELGFVRGHSPSWQPLP